MGDFAIRLRYPGGNKAITVSPQATYDELKHLIYSLTNIMPDCQVIKSGYPPKGISADDSISISELGISSGETLIIEALPEAPKPIPKQNENKPVPQVPPQSQIPNRDGKVMIRRIIPADNSCLFNSVGYAMEGRQKHMGEYLRSIIGVFVESDPVNFNEVMLGKQVEDYINWIKQPNSWGGAIELAILSNYYQVEIAAVSVQNARVDLFGEDGGYNNRIYVIYDGIHYDVLVRNRSEDSPEDQDETCFSQNDQEAYQGAVFLANDMRNRRQFTDLANFDLMCGVCNKGLKGESDALEHCKTTGHTNFQEIHK
ncbi:unnamed protein product [Blepharisma stoltei]|uniref:Ubiquitin thioesterase OTU n=1 Tax=Blepharisma stoltei TaxID=1481888 RepID=A0AAU9IBT0_9CILI|nr:unnamed protein product [Blepharisma stoltei]